MDLKFYYQNVQGLRTKTVEFKSNVMCGDFDIIVITETNLADGFLSSEVFDDRYIVYRNDRDIDLSVKQSGGGCLIAVKSSIKSFRLSSCEVARAGWENIWVSLIFNKKKILIHTCYIPPVSPFVFYEDNFDNLADVINLKEPHADFFLFGDYNLPTIRWDLSNTGQVLPSSYAGRSASALIDTLNLLNLAQFNHIPNYCGHTLDLLMSNISPSDIFFCRSVDLLIHEDRNHPAFELNLSIHGAQTLSEPIRRKCNFFRADYSLINNMIRNLDWDLALSDCHIDAAVDKFYSCIDPILKLIPLSNTKSSKFPSWYSKKLINLINEKSKIKSKLSRTPNPSLRISFAEFRRQVKYEIRTCYNNYISSIEDSIQVNTKYFFSYTKSIRKTNVMPCSMKYDNLVGNDAESIANLFATHFESVYRSPLNTVTHQHDPSDDNVSNSPVYSVTQADVGELLKSLDINKVASPDGLPNVFLKNTADTISKPLSILFNLSLSESVFPSSWKQSHIMPILKSGDKSAITNYRPISILSATSKVFEKILHTHIYDQVRDLLASQQHGFVRGKSTVSNLLEYTTYLSDNIMQGGQVDTIYTDFAKAFDRVDHSVLLKKLHYFNFR